MNLQKSFRFDSVYNLQISHVMKFTSFGLIILLAVLAVSAQQQQTEVGEEGIVDQLQEQIQSLDPNFPRHFIDFYHLTEEERVHSQKNSILNMTRVLMKQSTYFVLVAKMYLYRILPNNNIPELRPYNTKSNYMAIYFYLRVAAEYFQNKEAYYLLGILEHFKLVPDKLLETNIESLASKTPQQQLLWKYLEQSHLYNAESMLFMSSALGFHPASLVMGSMNRNHLGTSENCTAALAYYLSVIKQTYVEDFQFRQIYTFEDSMEDQLFVRKKVSIPKSITEDHFIEDTQYYDDEIIEATSQLADSYYMGSGGHLRNLTRAAKLYEKLAQGGSRHGKVMAGICYFKGEGVPVDRAKAYKYFTQTAKDEISDYMLLGMKYYQILETGSKQRSLSTMLHKYKAYKKNKERMGSHLNYLIGSAIIKGELKEKDKDGNDVAIPEAEGYQLLDTSAAQGNAFAKVLLGILFADGANGLKYGCQQATKYFAEGASIYPFFKNRISTAQVALYRGETAFPMIKYMQLAMIGYQNAYVNLLYLLEVYGQDVLNMKSTSWSIKTFKKNQIYKELHANGLIDVQSFILKLYTIKGKAAINFNNMEKYLSANSKSIKEYHSYIRKKAIRWGSLFDKKSILTYYNYKLTVEEKGDYLPLLTSLASGDSRKLYVSEARYLLGKHYHQKALENKTTLTPNEHFRILGEYNRAVKSQLFGLIIFHIEEYLLGNQTTFNLFESQVGQDFLAYIFVLSIAIFVLYYLRSKRIDHFHKAQLEKQLRKAAEEMMEKEWAERQNKAEQKKAQYEEKIVEEREIDNTQPIIVEDEPKGVRIGGSQEENL